MKSMIQTILYATDLSPNSAYALQFAINSAVHHDARIVILHVLEAVSPTALNLISAYMDEDVQQKMRQDNSASVKEEVRGRIQTYCDARLKEDAGPVDRIASIEVCLGYPAEVILQKAAEFGCEVIIMGSHGKGIISQTFLGSVSKRVLRRSRKPVFIIPLPRGAGLQASGEDWAI